MTKKQKIGLVSLILVTFAYIKIAFFPGLFSNLNIFNRGAQTTETQQAETSEQTSETEQEAQEEEKIPKMYVSVYFIGQNKSHNEVYKIVKREYDQDREGSKIGFAIKSLLKGPSAVERKRGVYSEIPRGTKLLSITEKPNKVIINLSSDFEQGGGTDGLYKRLYQLIKTANRNTSQDVYLKINGVDAEVIGGEGIMINQPLNSNSLGE